MSVVVTGMGIVSPLGCGLPANRAGLRQGRGGIRRITRFNIDGFPVPSAGEVDWPGLPTDNTRPDAMVEMALAEAFALAGLDGRSPHPRRALSLAIGKPTVDLEALARQFDRWSPNPTPETVLANCPQFVAGRDNADPAALAARLAEAAGAGGEVYCCYTACASGNDALGTGKRLIERGLADVVVAGGTDSQVHPLSLIEFELLSALSHELPERACRPFDRNRTGFVVGEGAAVIVLEAEEHARRRGAEIVGRLTGYGTAMDCFGLTKCHPEGRGAAAAMKLALAEAGLPPERIDYINAHGTATVLNDQAEAAAIRRVWGAAAARVPVSSTKAMTGHLLTSASAVEAVLSLLALTGGFIPPNLNFETPDPECILAISTEPDRPAQLRHVISNGFGFGGQNSSLIFSAI